MGVNVYVNVFVCVSFNHHILCDTLQSLCKTKSSHPSTAAFRVDSVAHKMEAEVCVHALSGGGMLLTSVLVIFRRYSS